MSSRHRHRLALASLAILLLVAATIPAATSAAEPTRRSRPSWTPPELGSVERLLVRFAPRVDRATRVRAGRALGLERVDGVPSMQIEVFEDGGRDLSAVAAELAARPDVISVEADGPHYAFDDLTDEPGFDLLWGLHNSGQVINGFTGKVNVDIDLPQAHTVTTGDTSIVIAVIDDGVDFSHPDLADRAWVNEAEASGVTGEDDDDNGYIDDINGVNFCATTPNGAVFGTGSDHGTHVAGTIAASLDGQGVVGVAPTVRIMALRFLCPGPLGEAGDTADAIKALEYASAHGVRIANNSWGGGPFSTALRDAIAESGLLFVAAAGNGGFDGRGDNNDTHPVYPASYDLSNIISVAAVHNEGALSSFSNYGRNSVDISAPGEDVLSTFAGSSCTSTPCWAYLNGTSMAAPHVSGVAALAATVRPHLLDDPVALKAHLMGTAKPLAATAGRTVTGGIVDAMHAVDTVAPGTTAPTSYGFVSGSRLGSSVVLRVGWPAATDAMSGVGSYAIGQSVDGAAWKVLTSTTGTSVERSTPVGRSIRHRVRARDRGLNYGQYTEGPTVRPRLYQQGTGLATYKGRWSTSRSSSASGGSTRYATRAGASVTFTFTGRAVAVVVPKGPSRGKFKAYLDGTLVKTVDTHKKSSKSRVVVFARAWPTSGRHTLRLVVSGTAGHPRVDVDGFLVLQ